MALPKNPDARLYYRSAFQWLEDADFVLKTRKRTRAAVYLAGYTVECLLKALILSAVTRKKKVELLRSKALYTHSLNTLQSLYLAVGGPPLTRQVQHDFLTISDWDTELRYQPRAIEYQEATRFLKSVDRIATWANGRL